MKKVKKKVKPLSITLIDYKLGVISKQTIKKLDRRLKLGKRV